MNPSDIPILRARLCETAEALGAKAIGEAGLKAWQIALKDFPCADVIDALDQWLRTKQKMPVPADIRALCSAHLSDRIEIRAIADKAEFAAGARNMMAVIDKRIGREHLTRIHEILAKARANPPSPDDWWHKLIKKMREGQPLCIAQIEFSTRAWINAGRPKEWTPPGLETMAAVSESEREAMEEREAIQKEGRL